MRLVGTEYELNETSANGVFHPIKAVVYKLIISTPLIGLYFPLHAAIYAVTIWRCWCTFSLLWTYSLVFFRRSSSSLPGVSFATTNNFSGSLNTSISVTYYGPIF